MKQKLKTILKGLSASVFVLTFALLLTFCSKEGKDETISQSHTEEQQSAVLSNSKSSAKVTTFGFDTCSYPYSGTSLGNDEEDWMWQVRDLRTLDNSDKKYFFEGTFPKSDGETYGAYKARIENYSNVSVVVRMVYVIDPWGCCGDKYQVADGCYKIGPGESRTLGPYYSVNAPDDNKSIRFEIIVPNRRYGKSGNTVRLGLGMCYTTNDKIWICNF